jgi:hypothetical protein
MGMGWYCLPNQSTVPVSVATLAEAQRTINERKEAIAKKALERDHWVCERCT